MTYQKINNLEEKPWMIIAYDDFDLIKFPDHFPLRSIWNIFVGSTMINMSFYSSNPCNNFMINKYLNEKVSLRINEKQV